MAIQPQDDTGSQGDGSSPASSTRKRDIIRSFLRISKSNSKIKSKKSLQFGDAEPPQHTSEASSISSKTSTSPSQHLLPGSSSDSGDRILPQQQPSEDFLRADFFPKNLSRPFIKTGLPASPDRIEMTQQLAYCNSLIIKGQLSSRRDVADEISIGTLTNNPQAFDVQKPQVSVPTINGPQELNVEQLHECDFDEAERIWMKEMEQDPVHQDYLRWMANRVVEEFAHDFLKDTDAIAEVLLLGPVLDRETYRTLLTCVLIKFDESRFLNIAILQGLVQLIEGASPGYLEEEDLVKILAVLQRHLEKTDTSTHKHLFQTTLATSRLLDAMANSLVRYPRLAHEQQSLGRILERLKDTTDPIMKFQVIYAIQALQYLQEDESALETVSRFSGGVVKAALGTTSDWKLEPSSFIKSLDAVRQAAGESYEVTQEIMEHTVNRDNRLGALQNLVEGVRAGNRHEWYLALLAAKTFAQDGRLADFNVLVCEAPYHDQHPFQLGVCQILGDIAADPLWDAGTREQAVEFLGALLTSHVGWKPHTDVKQWIFLTLTQISMVSDGIVKRHALATLRELDQEDLTSGTNPTYSLWNHLPLPECSTLLFRAQQVSYVEYEIQQLKHRRLEESLLPVYIPPMAKANLRARDDELFPLLENVQEFLTSERQVMLILGDSGAGKSTFNKHLESGLWHSYNSGGRIPLFVNLPALDRPDKELVTAQLRSHNFSEAQICELRETREFVVICDGYDETQLTANLHTTNLFNRPGQWKVKLVISCRTQYLGHDYLDFFLPHGNNHYGHAALDLFQEAVVAPFSRGQIESYVVQYVPLEPRTWPTAEYMNKLSIIPHLMDLVSNPFLLSLCLEALPGVTQASDDLASLQITRLKLYDTFVDHWFTINKRRLHNSALSAIDREILSQLMDANFASKGIEFCTRLASAIFKHQGGTSVVQYVHIDDKESWKAEFFGPQPDARLLRDSSPLTRSGTKYRFLHRSMLEYFFTRAIHGPSSSTVPITPAIPVIPAIPAIPVIPVISNNPDISDISETSSSSNIHDVDTQEAEPGPDPETPIAQMVKTDGSLLKKNLLTEPSIIQFLCERVKESAEFKQELLAIIEQSKTDSEASVAAANAITILVRADVCFNGADLRGIRVPGADLSGGQFDSVRFQGADLTRVKLGRSWLRQADFEGALLEDVQFGELPYLQENCTIKSCAFSPDGCTMAVGLSQGEIALYSTATWTAVKRLQDHNSMVLSVAFSPDSQRLVSGGIDKLVRVWDVRNGRVSSLKGHSSIVTCAAFSPCGQQIASASHDKSVRLWDPNTGKTLFVLQSHSKPITKVVYAPNGHQLATSGEDGAIWIWNPQTGEPAGVWDRPLGPVWGLAYSPDGQWLASGHSSGEVRVWNADTGDIGTALQGHTAPVDSIDFSPNGQWIVSSGRDRTVRFWDARSGSSLSVLTGYTDDISVAIFSRDSSHIASGSEDGKVQLWEANTTGLSPDLQCHTDVVEVVQYSPDGRFILSGGNDRNVHQWDSLTGCPGPYELQHDGWIYAVAISPDGAQIATATYHGHINLWDGCTGNAGSTFWHQAHTVRSLEFSPCGQWIVSVDTSNMMRLWNTIDTLSPALFSVKIEGLCNMTFSPTGQQFATKGSGHSVFLWNSPAESPTEIVLDWADFVMATSHSLVESEDAAAERDRKLGLWKDRQQDRGIELYGHTGKVNCLAFSPCGQRLASGSQDETVRLWELQSIQSDKGMPWTCAAVVRGFLGPVKSISWSPTAPGEFVTGCYDRSVRVWRVSEGEKRIHVGMVWGSNMRHLYSAEVNLKGTVGLCMVNRRLLVQRGRIKDRYFSTKWVDESMISVIR